MSGARALARRDVRALVSSGTPWAAAAAFLALSGLLFWVEASNFATLSRVSAADPQLLAALNTTQGVVQPTIANLALVAAFVLPFLTMRLLAEERRSGGLEMLRTLALDDWGIVAGKYVAVIVVGAGMLALSLAQVLALWLAAPLVWSQIAAGYLGLMLLFSAMLAIGLAISALSPSQAVAASLTLALFVGLVVLDNWIGPAPHGFAATVADWSPITRLDPFSRGLIRLDSVAYYLFIDLVALTIAWIAVHEERRIG